MVLPREVLPGVPRRTARLPRPPLPMGLVRGGLRARPSLRLRRPLPAVTVRGLTSLHAVSAWPVLPRRPVPCRPLRLRRWRRRRRLPLQPAVPRGRVPRQVRGLEEEVRRHLLLLILHLATGALDSRRSKKSCNLDRVNGKWNRKA